MSCNYRGRCAFSNATCHLIKPDCKYREYRTRHATKEQSMGTMPGPITAPPRKPKVLILGYARHGKDTVAELMRDKHGYTFQSSSLFAAEHVVRPALAAVGVTYPTLEACYADRVNRRAFWYEAIAAYNDPPEKLATSILRTACMYVGMRSAREYAAARHLFDVIVWVDASGRGLPPEDTSSNSITFDPEQMLLLSNNGTLSDLEEAVAGFVRNLEWAAAQ